MTGTPERDWTVAVTIHFPTYGTEAQARASAERAVQQLGVQLGRRVTTGRVVVVDPATGERSDGCTAVVHHGPGHQSYTTCQRVGAHELHEAHLLVAGETVYWRGRDATTGPFDESPLDPDDPYTHVESRGYFVVCCRVCDADGEPLPQPFASHEERDRWARAHEAGTGHDRYHFVDPPGVTGPPEPTVLWTGTVGYEGVDTTDGRRVESLTWPRLPVPVVVLGTGDVVGTVDAVWREAEHEAPDLPQGGTRLRARGTVLRSAVGPDHGRVGLGMDVISGDVEHAADGTVVLRDGELRGVSLYPDGSGGTPAWPDAALRVDTEPSETNDDGDEEE